MVQQAGIADDKTEAMDAASQAAADYEALRQDISRLTQTVSQLVQHQADAAKSQMSQAYESAKAKVSQSAADAQDKVMSLEADLEARVTRNPIGAVAVALGVGIVLGMLSQSRN